VKGAALVLGAGRGDRLGDEWKAFIELDGASILRRAVEAAASATLVDSIVVAVPESLLQRAAHELAGLTQQPLRCVAGGTTRQESALRALHAASSTAVVVHDAARPLCPPALFDDVLEALDDADGAIVALPVTDTIKRAPAGEITATLDRSELVAAQTPQAFRTDVYAKAHDSARRDGVTVTDDAALVERVGGKVRVLPGSERNLKITTAFDLWLAGQILRAPGQTRPAQ
jgi:2-C-methyl-D-erythritol 4-phosphate cytidylyltransferase